MEIGSLLAPPKVTPALLMSPSSLFAAAISLRVVLLFYGIYQDASGPLKYTDIDYYVFTDAARYTQYGLSPYLRDTYRYTPLLAWMLLPTTWAPQEIWFSFGKVLFAASDVMAGWIMLVLLQKRGLHTRRALKYSAIWLLNPMVAVISTRGSSEGFLCLIVMGLLWAAETYHIALAGVLLGLSVHFKIYPFIYGVSIILALDDLHSRPSYRKTISISSIMHNLATFLNPNRSMFIFTSLATFSILNIVMYSIYGIPFMQHTYLHHLTRIDHRHNFSPFNVLLYLSSSTNSSAPHPATVGSNNMATFHFESLAFLPQLLLAILLIPLGPLLNPRSTSLSRLPTTMFAQTLAFVTFNKVCTSQYFLWYMVFLPIYLPNSVLIRKPNVGLTVLGAWAVGQSIWLWQAYKLEMEGESTFVPGLWLSSLLFFAVNCWILGVIVADDDTSQKDTQSEEKASSQTPNSVSNLKEKTETEGDGKRTDNNDDDDDDDDDDDSDVEEIPRDQTVEEMVRQQMSSARTNSMNQTRPPNQVDRDALLRDYMADVEKVVAQSSDSESS